VGQERTRIEVPPARPPTTTTPAPGAVVMTGGSPTASDVRAQIDRILNPR
jgi:hypothetical protein